MLDNLKFIGTLLRRYRDIGTVFSNKKKYRDCPDGIGTVNRSVLGNKTLSKSFESEIANPKMRKGHKSVMADKKKLRWSQKCAIMT